jgi:ATP-dependent protease ClpP protease subunit
MPTKTEFKYSLDDIHNYNVNLDTREIYLIPHSEQSDENVDVDHRQACTFVKNLRILDGMSNLPITIHQYSNGGQCDCGLMMYDEILRCNSPTIFIMHGSAHSIGTVIPQASTHRFISPNCGFMVHSCSMDPPLLTNKQLQSWSNNSQFTQDTIIDIYAKRCKWTGFFKDEDMDDKDIIAFILDKIDRKDDWFLTATEAVYYGFADEILVNKAQEEAIYKKLAGDNV